TMSMEPRHAEQSLIYEKTMRERNRMLKDCVRDPSWYAAIERQMAEAGAVIESNRLLTVRRLQETQKGADTAFPAAELSLKAADAGAIISDRDDLLAALIESRPRDMAAGRTLVGPHRDDLHAIYTTKGTPAKQCSTGEQKALLVSLILANGRALAQDFGAPPIYLLDEVAAHLDADRRAALYDEICALGAQAWMTGTGAELFDAMGARAMYLEVTDDAGVSTVCRH
ncbi:MAG: DNA replication and repair protein RecF, partial [Rhodobacterales bacterium]